MVRLNRIYTRTGDNGTTGLGDGTRVSKDDIRVEAFGTVDEANACIGLARQHLQNHPEIDEMLDRIQNDLFDLGAELASPDGDKPFEWEPLRVTQAQVDRVEQETDKLNADLGPLRSFVLPGGTATAAYLHLARTVSRRAERMMVELAQTPSERVAGPALKYINRLSDFFFVASRYLNARSAGQGKAGDVLWVPGQNR